MRVRATGLGWKGMMLLGALQCAFLATAYSNLFFLMIVFCCVLGALGLVQAIANVRGIAVTRLDVPMAAAGDERPVRVQLRAPNRRWDVAVELFVGDDKLAVAAEPIIAGEAIAHGTLPPRTRGVQRVKSVRVLSRYPFGFFVVSRRFAVDDTVVTWPDPRPARALRGGRGDDGAAHANDARGTSVAGLREFRTGDATRDVHWRATARRGTPIVKEREPEPEHARTVVIDRRCTAEALETTLSGAADLVLAARDAKTTLHLRSQDAAFTIGHEHGGAEPALRWLAAATCLPADAPAVDAMPGALLLPVGAEVRA